MCVAGKTTNYWAHALPATNSWSPEESPPIPSSECHIPRAPSLSANLCSMWDLWLSHVCGILVCTTLNLIFTHHSVSCWFDYSTNQKNQRSEGAFSLSSVCGIPSTPAQSSPWGSHVQQPGRCGSCQRHVTEPCANEHENLIEWVLREYEHSNEILKPEIELSYQRGMYKQTKNTSGPSNFTSEFF